MTFIKEKTLLYGASGHAKVICSIFESMNIKVESIFDDNKDVTLKNYNVIYNYDNNYKPELPILISIGDNKIRKKISEKITRSFSIAFHSSAILDDFSKIGFGTSILQSAIVQRDAFIGNHCIINTNSSIDHECIIEDFVHLAPSATLCGNVKVGEGTLIGSNATVLPNIKIGKWCIIGAGAVVTKNIPDFSIVTGIPGKIIKNLSNG